ncbi:MAG TPA: hypothetical protein VFQ53_12545 [Kofleriaceae bacterium]|nr:hypothetical protein [Kofleriaceae bacterium]
MTSMAKAKQATTKPKTKPAKAASKTPSKDKPFAGKKFAFYGEFAVWATYHAASPASVARKLGATLQTELDDDTDYVVFGDLKGTGRAEAKRKAEKLAGQPGATLKILDEAAYRELVRVDLTGKKFAFIGGFDCSPAGLEDGLLARMVTSAGGLVTADVDDTLDYLVVGNRRGPSKIALSNKADKLNEAGAHITKLDETAFLELVRVDKPVTGGELDFAGFINLLYGNVNEGKLGRALDMLRKESFKLYTHLDDKRLVGVVRSQSGSGSVYASWLTPEGRYGCAQPDLEECMGLQGTTCKHLLVLVVGLARTGQMPLAQALAWIRAAHRKSPQEDDELCAETFIQYKGAEAGEVDWRPTETIPEDFYAM